MKKVTDYLNAALLSAANYLDGVTVHPYIKAFFRDFILGASLAFIGHVLYLLVMSFVLMESLVVSGLDVTEYSVLGRALILIPYLIAPAIFAGIRLVRKVRNN